MYMTITVQLDKDDVKFLKSCQKQIVDDMSGSSSKEPTLQEVVQLFAQRSMHECNRVHVMEEAFEAFI